MKTLEQIDQEILNLNEKLKEIKGTETEVYTRIVGYHRAVDNWNKGKREEYNDRREFLLKTETLPDDAIIKINSKGNKEFTETKSEEIKKPDLNMESISSFKLFTSQYCPKCPPVKNFLKNIHVNGEEIDVSTDLGINIAKGYNVMSTPTIILFDENDRIVLEAFSIEDLKRVFSKKENLFLKN